MRPVRLGKRASVPEACEAARLHPIQYKAFAMITHQAASHLLRRNALWTRWRCVPLEVKTEIAKWVNEELKKQDIPEIREDVFEWRMSRALPDAARAAANKQQAESESQGISQSAHTDKATQ